MTDENFQIFLSYASDDKPTARFIYDTLRENLLDVWLDEEKLLGGEEWEIEIPKAIKKSDVVLLLLSNHSITKEGYFQKEIRFALDIANEKPEGTIFIIPLRLEDCEVPQSLKKWHYIDYFDEKWLDRLIRAFKERSDGIGKILHSLKTEFDLSFICDVCNEPINIYKNEGQIYILRKELFAAQRKSAELSKKRVVPSNEIEETIAHWHKSHYVCNEEVDSFYDIEIYRIRTLHKLLIWTSHLMWKRWLSNTDWPILIRDILGKEYESL